MIPTMIAVGLAIGLAASLLGRVAVVALVAVGSIGWGLLVDELVGGTLFGLVNVVVGLAVGVGIHSLIRSMDHRPG